MLCEEPQLNERLEGGKPGRALALCSLGPAGPSASTVSD